MITVPSPHRSSAGKVWVIRGLIRDFLAGHHTDGDRLTEAGISESYGVSRTPVREALLELAGLGLVELKRNCGAVVQDFGPDQIRDLYAVRSLLEVEATRLASEISRQANLIQTVRETVSDALRDIHSTTLEDHLAILDRLKHRDEYGAAEAMRRHLDQASASAVKAVQQLREKPNSES